MQQLLDALKAAEKAYSANESRETYNAYKDAAVCLYKAIWDALAGGDTVRITGKEYFQEHEILPEYIETISLHRVDWLWYVDSDKLVHTFSLSAADKVVVIDE